MPRSGRCHDLHTCLRQSVVERARCGVATCCLMMRRPDKSDDAHFDGWRAPRTAGAKNLVADIAGQLQVYERRFGKRARVRRPADQATFEATVAAITCNLAHLHFSGREGGIAVTRSNQYLGRKSRYRSPAENKTLPAILDLMSVPEMDFLVQKKGHRVRGARDQRTTIEPSQRFISKLDEFEVELDDLGRSPEEEVIILRAGDEGYWEKGKWVEYEDTPETIQWRGEIREINAWLSAAQITCDPYAGPDFIDVSNRTVTRRFTNSSFQSGGRLYGGFWQTMKTSLRREAIRLAGSPVTELDYGQMMLRIMYGLAGRVPPEGDLYAVPGMSPENRDGIKVLVLAMFFSEKALTRKPKDTSELLRGMSVKQWMDAVRATHPDIADQFHRGRGHQLQNKESEILIKVLARLRADRIIALPMHDGVIVPAEAMPRAKAVMEEVFAEELGIPAVVREET